MQSEQKRKSKTTGGNTKCFRHHLLQILCHMRVALHGALGCQLVAVLVRLLLEEIVLVVVPKHVGRWVEPQVFSQVAACAWCLRVCGVPALFQVFYVFQVLLCLANTLSSLGSQGFVSSYPRLSETCSVSTFLANRCALWQPFLCCPFHVGHGQPGHFHMASGQTPSLSMTWILSRGGPGYQKEN